MMNDKRLGTVWSLPSFPNEMGMYCPMIVKYLQNLYRYSKCDCDKY